MRDIDIIFRGKRVDNGEWITESETYIKDGDRTWLCDESNDVVKVIPETVGQYTGLCDKNVKRVFEGDIVRYGDTIHRVVFEQRNGTAYFGIVISDIETWLFGYKCPANLMEVIGNIYDNPELLKGGVENG